MIEEIKNPMLKLGSKFNFTVKPLGLRKRKEIENLRPAFSLQIPSTVSIEIDLSAYSPRHDSSFFSDGILDIFCFALSRIYKKFPRINSTFLDNKSFMEYSMIQIGIAFDETSNLKVLALQDSEFKSLVEIQEEILGLLDLYSSGETIPLNLFNSTITVTDLTSSGISNCVPTLSMGQAAIIAITQANPGKFVVTCTYDHQIVEGKYVAEFLNALKQRISTVYESLSETINNLNCSACSKSILEELAIGPSHRGFLVLRKSRNEEVLLCRVCFEGF